MISGFIGSICEECSVYLRSDQPQEIQNYAINLFKSLIHYDIDRVWWKLHLLSTSTMISERYLQRKPVVSSSSKRPNSSQISDQTEEFTPRNCVSLSKPKTKRNRENFVYTQNCTILLDFIESKLINFPENTNNSN